MTPFVREPQECFDDPAIKTVVLCWAARSSKTETIYNMLRKNIAVDHQSFIYAAPSEQLARDWSETRFQPSLRDCPATLSEIPDNSDLFKLTAMHFKHCSGWFIGAGSPSNLAGRGVPIIVADEIDKWREATGKETGALQNLLERNRERWNRKTVLTSTPTIESGQIWQEFLLGDQRYFMVPCPFCHQKQKLIRAQLKCSDDCRMEDGKWDLTKVSDSTFYECVHCNQPIREHQKAQMLLQGCWQASSKTREPGRASFHLNALYSPWTTWAEVLMMFFKATQSREELQRFINSWLAEPFYQFGDGKEFDDLLNKAKSAEHIEIVPVDHVAIVSADVQQDRLYFEARAHNKLRDSVGLDFGMLPDFEELELVVNKWKPFAVAVDARYRTNEVLNWCFAQRRRGILAIPAFGVDSLMVPFRWGKIPIEGGTFKGKAVEAIRFRPNDWKDEWFFRLKKLRTDMPKWEMCAGATDEYRKQLVNEVRSEKTVSGGRKMTMWVPRYSHAPNHYLDCATINLATFEAVRPIAFEVEGPVPPPNSPVVNTEAQSELEEMRRGYDDVTEENQIWR